MEQRNKKVILKSIVACTRVRVLYTTEGLYNGTHVNYAIHSFFYFFYISIPHWNDLLWLTLVVFYLNMTKPKLLYK